MPLKKSHSGMFKRLKKLVSFLLKKEKTSRKKLRLALLQGKKMAKAHTHLAKKVKEAKVQAAAIESAVFGKMVDSMVKKVKKIRKAKPTVKKTIKKGVTLKKRKKTIAKTR